MKDHQDWGDLFWQLSKKTAKGRVLIVFDEITWMGSTDSDFLGKLKNAWDLYFKKNDQLILALCGSISAWIEKNTLSSTGFLGRTSLNLTLEEMPLQDCAKFWDVEENRVSAYEKLKLLSVTGGIPRYLESITPTFSAEKNIQLENLVLSNREAIRRVLQISPSDIVVDNPFFQNKTQKQAGCQIDYMIQTKHNVVYLCEIKFSAKAIGMQVISDMQEKIVRLSLPKHFSYRPVLIHANEISESVEEAQYFSNIINLADFL